MHSRDGVAGQQLQARLEQQFLLKRIADLHGRSVLTRFLCQFTGGECGAGEPIATGFGPDIENRVAHAARRPAGKLVVPKGAQAKHIDEWISFKTFVEIDFAADGRDANAVAIMCDAGDNAGEEPPIFG